ncbi:uncharacterized protein VICG_00768 [Vittaforma corneae ATCC 50505]|uniref:Uncharacterized protein n=1 Tax=Vittaforma corneae (strain ATCC 50505) TaxID=993615 RepID=L2GPA2_VITCO|nr:uncharacterized protein VICG_00768 [Vittaforma corneae ATCC 50505]ELA42127.1 hypothetical protein VICG_00768 [Vittaforma corneae ATCC 50505]
MQRILEIIAAEDHEKLFTGENHPNIYDAIAPINNSHEIKEIERALKYYFEQVLQITSPSSKVHYEAQRMLMVCEKVFSSMGEDMGEMAVQSTRDLSDEIVDFYMESLKHFASYVDEEILNEHIRYLDGE